MTSVIVRITADNGIIGWGETCALGNTYQEQFSNGALAAISELAQHLIGAEILPRPLYQLMGSQLMGHNYAKAAIDIACWDALGQHLQRPLSDLLGGALTDKIPSYYAIGLEEPEEAARTARAKINEGYKRLQIKCGGRSIQEDIETIKAVYDIDKSIKLIADANRGWSMQDCIFISNALRNIPIALEQPCQSIAELRQIKPTLNHPTFLDENILDVATAIEAMPFCEGFGLKMTRLGGISNFSTMRDICAARHLPHTVDDNWGGDIIAAACTHMGATVDPNLMQGTWIAQPYLDHHYDKSGITVVDGFIDLPKGYGLGLTIDPDQFGPPKESYS